MTARRPLIRVDGRVRQLPAGDSLEGVNYQFEWDQAIALAVWTIPHNMNRYPSVTVVDTLGNVISPDISYVDSSIVQVTHGAAYAGKAYLN